jgi:hypothetical protein
VRPLTTLASLTCLAAALAAPEEKAEEKGKDPPVYFPTAVGAKRVLEVRATHAAPYQETEVVTKVEAAGGGHRVTVESPDPGGPPPTAYEVSAAGVVRVAVGGGLPDPPLPLLKLPAKAGDTWDWVVAGFDGLKDPPKLTFTVRGEEAVEVPAGKFQAVRVDRGSGRGPFASTRSDWYAPGVGLVKSVEAFGGTEKTSVLKAFTPGK